MTRATTTTRIASLRQRFTVEQPVRLSDASGGSTVTWTPIGTVWGAIRTTTGTERFQYDRITGTVSHEITIRHLDGLTPSDRLRNGARTYHIRAVLAADDRHRYLICLCEERDL
jgi:SPP1 family predicted phage head-tail adaptor